MPTYRLASTSLVNTPGLLAWGINGYHFPRDRKNLLKVFVETYKDPNSPPEEVWHQLLMGKIPYTVEDDCVVFEVDDNSTE